MNDINNVVKVVATISKLYRFTDDDLVAMIHEDTDHIRLIKLFLLLRITLGDEEKEIDWLSSHNTHFNDTPLDYIKHRGGFQPVLDYLTLSRGR